MEPTIFAHSWLGGDQSHELNLGISSIFARVCNGAVAVPREGLLVNGQHFFLRDQMQGLSYSEGAD